MELNGAVLFTLYIDELAVDALTLTRPGAKSAFVNVTELAAV